MEDDRWIVFSVPPLDEQARGILSMMNACDSVKAVASDNLVHLSDDSVGVVFIADTQDPQATVSLISRFRRLHPDLAAVVSGAAKPAAAHMAALVAAGAHEFVLLPSTVDELHLHLRRASGHLGAPREVATDQPRRIPIRGFIYTSAACSAVAAKLPMIAGCHANVLITGETGTGKEVCAQAVHYLSERASRPWVAVNCAALPADLVENELFGHAKGAYTTAHTARPGLIQEAEGGTLFLDEIDSLPMAAQAKLLRFLQEREYRPVGSNVVMHADVRIIAATNGDPYAQVQRGTFRQDLYFRLNVLNVCLPALRERREDISVLAKHFLHYFAHEFNRPVDDLSPAALGRLRMHDWPGNVRELRHVIERAVLLSVGPVLGPSDIEIDRFSHESARTNDTESFRSAKSRAVDSFERGFLEQLLAAHGGNVTHAAQAAQKDRRAFFELMRKHHIDPRQFRPDAQH